MRDALGVLASGSREQVPGRGVSGCQGAGGCCQRRVFQNFLRTISPFCFLCLFLGPFAFH